MKTIRKLDERGPAREIRRTINQIIDAMGGLRIASAPNIQVKRTAIGTSIKVAPQAGGPGEPKAPESAQRFKITEIHADYFVCRKVDVDNLETGPENINVARPLLLRKDAALLPELKGGEVPTYAPNETQARTYPLEFVSQSGQVRRTYLVTQRIYPRYAVNDIIFGAKINGDVFTDLTNPSVPVVVEWLDLNADGRAWQIIMGEVEICYLGNTRYAAFHLTAVNS